MRVYCTIYDSLYCYIPLSLMFEHRKSFSRVYLIAEKFSKDRRLSLNAQLGSFNELMSKKHAPRLKRMLWFILMSARWRTIIQVREKDQKKDANRHWHGLAFGAESSRTILHMTVFPSWLSSHSRLRIIFG